MHVSKATMIRWETQWMPWNGLGWIFAFFRSVLYAFAACKVHNFLRTTIRKFTRKRNATGGAMRSTFNSWVRGYMPASGFDSNSAPSKWYQGSWTTVNNLSVAVSRVNFDRRTRKSPSNVIIVNKFTKRPLMLRRSYQKYLDSYFINGQTLLPKKSSLEQRKTWKQHNLPSSISPFHSFVFCADYLEGYWDARETKTFSSDMKSFQVGEALAERLRTAADCSTLLIAITRGIKGRNVHPGWSFGSP